MKKTERHEDRRDVPPITGVVLAGGRGRRMGGLDKGLVPLHGRPIVSHVLARLAPQVDDVLVSANRNRDRYEAFGHPVISDPDASYAGPLAGLLSALVTAKHGWVITVPCDSPALPSDLVVRLWAGLRSTGSRLAIARTGTRIHPVFCLCPTSLADDLAAFLSRGGRAFRDWIAALDCVEVPFDDVPDAFDNINTPEDLARREGIARHPGD
ncbi:MAG: molybdenum cofactor guanylyltransferase MobA [Burkholderiales bacterium]